MLLSNTAWFSELLAYSLLGRALSSLYLVMSIFLLFLVVKLLMYMIHINSSYHIGYVPTNLKTVGPVLQDILQKYVLDQNQQTSEYHLVEPGAGLATVSKFLAKKYTWKNILAIEDEGSVLAIAKWQVKLSGLPIEFAKENVLTAKFERPAVVYSYLLPDIIDKMRTNGQFKNCLLISLTFPLSEIVPTEKYTISSIQKQVLVYDFRD